MAATWLLAALLACPAPAARADTAQIHIDRNVAAGEMLIRCAQAAEGDDPAQAAHLLAQLLEQRGEQLVEVEGGLYVPVAAVARRQVAEWPPAAVERLRLLWDPPAAEQWQGLADSTDYAQVARFARRYFPTRAGARAAERAARLALEAGQTDLARLWLDDLLRFHPDRTRHARHWQMLQAAALTLGGDADAGRKALQAAQSQPAAPPPAAGGAADNAIETGVRAEQLSNLSALPVTSQPAVRIGDPSQMAVLWQADLVRVSPRRASADEQRPMWLPAPVLHEARNLVLVQHGRTLRAFDRHTGRPVWRYQPLSQRDQQRTALVGTMPPRRPAVWQDRVYMVCEAALPQEQPGPLQVAMGLHCLDAATGRPMWVRTVGEMLSRSIPVVLDGTPVADGRSVYVAARTMRAGGYQDVSLLRVDAFTGRLLGQTHLFGVARPEYVPTDRIVPVRLGVRSGLVLVASGEGAVAAIDAQTLEPVWVRSLKPEAVAAPGAQEAEGGPSRVPNLWADAPLRMGDALVVPLDAGLQVLNALTGRWERAVVIGSPILDLTARPAATGEVGAVADNTFYRVSTTSGQIVQEAAVGRPAKWIGGLCATADGRFVLSVRESLGIVEADGSRSALPIEPLPAGLLTAGDGRIYLVTAEHLTCIGRGQELLVSLQEASRGSRDPMAAVQVMELALRMRQTDAALEAMQRAVTLGAADPARADAPLIERFFESCLEFAAQYGEQKDPQAQAVAERLLEAAGRSASDATAKIRHRAAVAQLRTTQGRHEDAVVEWQSLLADRRTRETPRPESLRPAAGTTGEWAQQRIAEAIRRQGRAVYRRFDVEAAARLEAESQRKNREGLEELIARYPNSLHAAGAQLAIGEILLERSDPRPALQPLRMAALADEADPLVPRQAMVRLAEAYTKLGHARAAQTWIRRLAQVAPQHAFRLEGQGWTAATYVAQVDRNDARPEAAPRVDLPLAPVAQRTFDDAVALIGPAESVRQGATGAAPILAWSAGRLEAVDAASLKSAWPQPVRFRTQPRLLAARPDRLVLFDLQQVTGIEPRSGRLLWRWSGGGPDPDGPEVDPETLPQIRGAAATPDSVIAFASTGLAVCLDIATGQIRWQRRIEPAIAGRVAAGEDLAVYAHSDRNRVTCQVLDARTGEPAAKWTPRGNAPGEDLFVLSAGMVLRRTPRAVEAYDAYTGRALWQVNAQHAFATGGMWLNDMTLYLVDGQREALRIDALSGEQAWRARIDERIGSLVRVIGCTGHVWVVGERGACCLDEVAGRLVGRAMLPEDLGPEAMLRDAQACTAGLLGLVVQRRARPQYRSREEAQEAQRQAMRAAIVLLECNGNEAGARLVASVEDAPGLVSGWAVRDGAAVIAAGDRLISLYSRQQAAR